MLFYILFEGLDFLNAGLNDLWPGIQGFFLPENNITDYDCGELVVSA